MKSQFNQYRTNLVIELNLVDLDERNYLHDFMTEIERYDVHGVILELSKAEVITSANIKLMKALCNALTVYGKRTLVCGISPLCASVLINFLPEFNFSTALNVERALHEIDN